MWTGTLPSDLQQTHSLKRLGPRRAKNSTAICNTVNSQLLEHCRAGDASSAMQQCCYDRLYVGTVECHRQDAN